MGSPLVLGDFGHCGLFNDFSHKLQGVLGVTHGLFLAFILNPAKVSPSLTSANCFFMTQPQRQNTSSPFTPPGLNCALCPRLCDFRAQNRIQFPDKFNAPVPSFGPLSARLLIIGLAPGLRGANFSGRPFTGDFAGDVLYQTLLRYALARGTYGAHIDDGIDLIDTRITNAVRCVPPENKPTPAEQNTCRAFLVDEINAMPNLQVILTLGQIAHNATLKTLGARVAAYKFAHNAVHRLPSGLVVVNTYHSSRYNVNTGRLTQAMFDQVFETITAEMQKE
jgi:uracil-DNA glycosylase family 4